MDHEKNCLLACFVCVCLHVCVCVCVCMCVWLSCMWMCVCMCVWFSCMWQCVCVCVYRWLPLCASWKYACMCVFVSVCVSVCMCLRAANECLMKKCVCGCRLPSCVSWRCAKRWSTNNCWVRCSTSCRHASSPAFPSSRWEVCHHGYSHVSHWYPPVFHFVHRQFLFCTSKV